ncbi:MAG: fasciclin domain-containing protein [Caulobacteraceae bacterium]
MHLIRFATTTLAAATLALPIAAMAAPGDAPAAPDAATAAPAAPAAPALPSIPKLTPGPSIYDTLKSSGQFTILLKAVDQAGLAPVLQKYPNLTFFAPTDAAMNALPPDVLTKLFAQNDTSANQLQQILKYHLINAVVDSSKLAGHSGQIPTVEATSVTIDGSNPNDLLVNNADIIQADVKVANGGIINVIDKVLIPKDSPFAAPAAPAASASAAPAPAGT